MNNRRLNATNPYQGDKERVLCVCSAGLLRSPTVAVVMAQHGYNTRSAGLETNFALIPVDDVLLYWADSIVVMDEKQAEEIDSRCNRKIYNFALPDNFEYMDKELVSLVEQRVKHLDQWAFN